MPQNPCTGVEESDGPQASAPEGKLRVTFPVPVNFPSGATVTSAALSTTSAMVHLVCLHGSILASRLTYNVVGAGANADNVVRVAIYSEDGKRRVVNVTDAVGVGTGQRTVTFTPVLLEQGNYYVMICLASGTGAGPTVSVLATLNFGITGPVATEPDVSGDLTITGGAAPATFNPTAITTPADDRCVALRLDGAQS